MSQIINSSDYGNVYGVELKCLRDVDRYLKQEKSTHHKFRRYSKEIRLNGKASDLNARE